MAKDISLPEAIALIIYWKRESPVGPPTRYEREALAHAWSIVMKGARDAITKYTAQP